MENGHSSSSHHLTLPPGLTLTHNQINTLHLAVTEHHTYHPGRRQCSSLLVKHIHAPLETVWSIVRHFDKPELYKAFVRRCSVEDPSNITVGCIREVDLVSGLPLISSVTERLDMLDDEQHIIGFSIISGFENFRYLTTLHGFDGRDGRPQTVVLESYLTDVPEAITAEEARIIFDTINKTNLDNLASVTERMMQG